MTTALILHYAPDNASLPVRLVLEELQLPFETRLVDRATEAQRTPAYLALNPAGLIPALETPDGVIFETAAILLWLADRSGQLAPMPDGQARGSFLKWLLFASNTLHAELRRLFYAGNYIGDDPDDQEHLRHHARRAVLSHLRLLEDARRPDTPLSVLDFYLAAMLRWCALYPRGTDHSWFDLKSFPQLHRMAAALELRDSAKAAQQAEGLGTTPFTAPHPPQPPEGTAI
ncbi:glutathione S-transferase family protein [Roseobacter ponti]|uniref:Glutathione S-transferase family protein n=1 Tax=Roseobacter ponti TaxID=1891787 RepID=A0A858SUV0_9RHOB|nr:glutathione S-transferase family protein [Roseobacter ponti]QJF52050.1 glutathione S-transferase family protein [Roseobacter ponti]